jgi:hypothetical protein
MDTIIKNELENRLNFCISNSEAVFDKLKNKTDRIQYELFENLIKLVEVQIENDLFDVAEMELNYLETLIADIIEKYL